MTSLSATGAAGFYKALLDREPDHAQALGELGTLAGAAGRHDEAVRLLEKACSLDSQNLFYLHNYGESLRNVGRLAEAEAALNNAIKLDERFAPAYKSLGEIAWTCLGQAKNRGDSDEAARLAGEFSKLMLANGNLLLETGDIPHSIAAYRRVLEALPDHARALSNLGNALCMMGLVTEAEAACRKAIRIEQNFPEAWNNLGNALTEQGRYDEALRCFDSALALKPKFAEAIHNKGSGSLFNLNFRHDLTAVEIDRRHQQWGAAFAHQAARVSCKRIEPGQRLRVGYLSADFRRHAMLNFIEPILACHDTSQFEVFCYAQGPARDEHTHRLMAYGHKWIWIHDLDDEALATRIEDDGIDILVDCVGHTKGTRLRALASKPAPVMILWLGYLGATGLPAMDYRLIDDWMDPPGKDSSLRLEKALSVPGGMMAYRPYQSFPDVSELPALQRGYITFGSLNNIQKFNPLVAKRWAAILKRSPRSRLIMQSKYLADFGMAGRVRGLFEAYAIGAERLDLRPHTASFLETYAEIDMALDTFPYGGGATTCDALWMGVPVITFSGDGPRGRLTTSILNQIGRPEWIASSPEEYVAIACDMASNTTKMRGIRAGLRQTMRASTLCDEEQFVRRLEQVYRSVVRACD